MRFLVGGSQGIFEVSGDSVKKIRGGHIYGVTFSQTHIYACERISNGTNIVCLDRNYKQVYAHRVPGGSVHQAHYDMQTGHLFVTITREDQLLEFDVEKKKEIKRHKWATGPERHMNSVWRSPHTGAMYVYEHNTNGAPTQNKQIGGVLRLGDDYKPVKKWEMANKGHNVMIHNGWIYVVNSFDESLIRKDIETGAVERLIETKEHPAYAPRGLAFSDQHILMGLTELASRKDRHKTRKGIICVYDRQYKKIKEYEIASGQMYEVRFLDRLDYAHNRVIFDTGEYVPPRTIPCPENTHLPIPRVPAVAKSSPPEAPPPKQNQHLFILSMNDSGSTFLQNALSHCKNCVSFRHKKNRPHGLEGQSMSYWKKKNKGWYPRDIDHGVVKVFSEKKEIWTQPNKFNWKEVKNSWQDGWKQNEHFKDAKPRILLEKTPSSLFSVDMYDRHFPDCLFLIMHRNPYVVCEGIRRTVKQHKKKDYSWERCAKHWVECTRQQIENIRKYAGDQKRAIWFKYEDLVTKPGHIREQIVKFIPALHDLDFSKPSTCHSIDGNKPQPVKNYNNRQLANLTPQDYAEINSVLDQHEDVIHFFKYKRRTEAP